MCDSMAYVPRTWIFGAMAPVVMLKVDVYFGWNAVSREVARPDVIRLCTLHADWKVALSCGFELFPISCTMYGSSGLQ